jgi:hypothetical protein
LIHNPQIGGKNNMTKIDWKSISKKVGTFGVGGLVIGAGIAAAFVDDSDDVATLTADNLQMEGDFSTLESSFNAVGIENDKLMADLESFKLENEDLTSEIDNLTDAKVLTDAEIADLKLEVSVLKTENDGVFWINKDLIQSQIEDEFDRYDSYNGTNFDDDEMSLKYWSDATFEFNVDEDGDGFIDVSEFSIKYDDGNDEYVVSYRATIDLDSGEINDVDLYEA